VSGDPRQLLEQVRAAGVEFIHLQFTDIPGTIKGLTIPAARLPECLERGFWFDGSAVEGLARVAENDLYLQPDPATFALLPWEPIPTARLVCDIRLPDGSPYPADPRGALQAVLAEADALGFGYRLACELEFFVFEQVDGSVSSQGLAPVDKGGYFEVTSDRAARLCTDAAIALRGFGFDVETMHNEGAPGQHEIDLVELGALQAADAIVALKLVLRALGRRDGLLVSFMPKPLEGVSGSGLHAHQRLVNQPGGANVFFDPAGDYQLSATGGHFIAGQLAHARGMCAIIAPLVNSYQRLMGGAEAPAQVSWARLARSALVRVPEATPGLGTRVELRGPDPSCNPYLAFAAMLKTGLDGIEHATPLPAPIEVPGHSSEEEAEAERRSDPLPQMLNEALEELDWDPVVRAALGQPIYERFLAAKEQEWTAYRRHISQWEIQNYLESA
jgi:glutamine synthetase